MVEFPDKNIYLYSEGIDFRKGIKSLSNLISINCPNSNLTDSLFIFLVDFITPLLENGDMYGMIVNIIKTMPGAPFIMVLVLLTMVAFYATSFDSIALTASCYSYHTLKDDEQPNKAIQLIWCILLILLPIGLLFEERSMSNLQSVSIVAAFPIGIVIVMIAISFLKDAKELLNKKN